MLKDRLSSDNLYHFKSDAEVVKLILKYGFRHSMWPETLPYKQSKQQNFTVCFCDIRIEDASYHRKTYGDNALVLTKDWGIKNGISPVRYIHENSPGISPNYIKSKNNFREIRETANDRLDMIMQDYSIFSILLDEGKLTHDYLIDDLNANPKLLPEMGLLETELQDLVATLKATKQDTILIKFLGTLINRISDLHNELENRDSFMRAYSEDFTHPATQKTTKGKILYDEKEWRSIKYASQNDLISAMANGFLPGSYNLNFHDNDVLAILLKDEATLENIKEFITSNTTLLNPEQTLPKLKTIDQYQES